MDTDTNIISAREFIDKLTKEYIENHIRNQERDELIAENNIEKRDIKGYHGREILELLQNADDAYQKSIDRGDNPQSELEVTICYKNDILTVTNTGTCFDESGIKAIVQGNNSPKSGKYIGNKGTGFRSILNWANKVKILSGNFNIEFSKEIADSKFKEIKDKPQIKKQIDKNPHLYIPMLAVPVNIKESKYRDDTTIEIFIDPTKLNDDFSVLKQIENIDLRILLFLPNISQINIITENNNIVYKRSNNTDETQSILIEKNINGKVEIKEIFYLFRKIIPNAIEEDNQLKDIELSIAVPQNMDTFINRHIYSFFPLLDTQSPFNCVFHASYQLGDHRNTINESEENKKIIKEQLLFLVEIANQFVNKGNHSIAYKLLIPSNFSYKNWRFNFPFLKFELEDYYLNLLSSQKIFLTVNGENISIKDNPKIISEDYPSFFIGKGFEKLLKPFLDEDIISLLKVLANREKFDLNFDEEDLLGVINLLSDNWSIIEQVETFIWWNMQYKNSIPNLLKTRDNQWLNYQQECYFLIGDFDEKGLPSWAKIPALHKEYQKELFCRAEKIEEVIKIKEQEKEMHISRIICQNNIFSTINFKYRDRSNIISTVNSSVSTYNESIDFIKWLWKNYGKNPEWNPPGYKEGTGFKYNFPDMRNNDIQNSDKLFFGSDYKNWLAEKLFDDSYRPFPSADTFDVIDEKIILFQDFISKFGVKKYPAIEIQEIYPSAEYSKEYEKEIKSNYDLGSSTRINCKYNLPYIKNLEYLLTNLSTLEIIEWIINDHQLYGCLFNPFYSSGAKITYCGNLQQYYRDYSGRIKNYILEVFNKHKWIEIDGIRYSPRQILQNFKTRNNQKFADIVPVINTEMLEEIAKNIHGKFSEVVDVFNIFNFADRVIDLSSEDFYGLMLTLPTLDFSHSVELSKAIYRIVEQSTVISDFENSDNKEKFFKEGKILVRHKGQLEYILAQDAYLPSLKIIDKKNTPIVEKGQRTNNKNFIVLFGCREYEKEYSIIENSISISNANASFQKYFQEFQKYACAYAEKNDNIERYGMNLKITLVSEISLSDIENQSKITVTEEYTNIRDKTTNWYITVFNKDFDINNMSEIIENIYTNIANTPRFDASKLGELFRTKEKKNREFLIQKEFGSLSVIGDKSYQNQIKNNFIKVLKIIDEKYDINKINIDFDDFYSIQNSSCIIELLKKIGIDIENFKNMGFVYNLDLIPYFRKELKSFIQKEKRRFKDYKFTCAKSDEKLQSEFISIVNEFENFYISDYKNSITFSVVDEVVGRFGEWRTEENILSADEEYAKNYEEMNQEKLFEDEISNDTKAQQMIYFKKIKEFNEWIDSHRKTEQKENGTDEPYLRYRNIVPKIDEISYRQSVNIKEKLNGVGKKKKLLGAYTYSQDEKYRRNKKIIGNKGELLIYNLLCDKVGKENVFPRSEAFVELEIIKPGQAMSGEYDISYCDKDGIEYYVEVKTGNKNSFIISPGELQYARDNAEKYKLFVVYDVDMEQPKCIELPIRFWEDSKFRKREIVERIEFEF